MQNLLMGLLSNTNKPLKFAIEQSLHLLIGLVYSFGFFGDDAADPLQYLTGAIVVVFMREIIDQWPINRLGDSFIDSFFLTIGVFLHLHLFH